MFIFAVANYAHERLFKQDQDMRKIPKEGCRWRKIHPDCLLAEISHQNHPAMLQKTTCFFKDTIGRHANHVGIAIMRFSVSNIASIL
jgi:hypothetical protein